MRGPYYNCRFDGLHGLFFYMLKFKELPQHGIILVLIGFGISLIVLLYRFPSYPKFVRFLAYDRNGKQRTVLIVPMLCRSDPLVRLNGSLRQENLDGAAPTPPKFAILLKEEV